jgi:hypothetical protein
MVDPLSGSLKLIGMASKGVAVLAKRNDEALAHAVQQECLGAVLELQNRVAVIEEKLKAKGQQAANLGALRTEKHLKDFAAAYAEAIGDEKRDALMNIAARQFDSSWLNTELRAYWFEVVRSLTDFQIVVLRKLSKQMIGVVNRSSVTYDGKELDPDPDQVAAFADLLPHLQGLGLATSKGDTFLLPNGSHTSVAWYSLSSRGKAVVRAMAPIEPSPPSGAP